MGGCGVQIGAHWVEQAPSDQSFAGMASELERPKQGALAGLTGRAGLILDSLSSSGRRSLAGSVPLFPRLALYWPTTAVHDAMQQQP